MTSGMTGCHATVDFGYLHTDSIKLTPHRFVTHRFAANLQASSKFARSLADHRPSTNFHVEETFRNLPT